MSKWDKTYFDKYEDKGWNALTGFNETYRMFSTLNKLNKDEDNHMTNCDIDASGTSKDRKFAIEIKNRNVSIDQYDTIFIEDYKMADLLLYYMVHGLEPLYINFFNDGNVAIWNLKNLKEKPQERVMSIRSGGYNANQLTERRYELRLSDAVVINIKDAL